MIVAGGSTLLLFAGVNAEALVVVGPHKVGLGSLDPEHLRVSSGEDANVRKEPSFHEAAVRNRLLSFTHRLSSSIIAVLYLFNYSSETIF